MALEKPGKLRVFFLSYIVVIVMKLLIVCDAM